MGRVSRKVFLASGAAASAAAAGSQATAQPSATPPAGASRSAIARALVLSGGGALGAYEAGVVAAIAHAGGIREGEPLRPYGLVCGTSIGALNGWFVATAQYAKLSRLWSTISGEDIIRLKPRYAKIEIPSTGVITKLVDELTLIQGLRKDVTGVLDGDWLRAWMLEFFGFDAPVVMPFFWAVTNLTYERREYFYLVPGGAKDHDKALAVSSARTAVGSDVPIREATREMLVDQLRASAALPAGFDPVSLPAPEGGTALYVDGGVTANTPVRVAAALAPRVDAVLLSFDPRFSRRRPARGDVRHRASRRRRGLFALRRHRAPTRDSRHAGLAVPPAPAARWRTALIRDDVEQFPRYEDTFAHRLASELREHRRR